jgi:indole-3-glycerol phosphate synthase
MSTILDNIIRYKRKEVDAAMEVVDAIRMHRLANFAATPMRSFSKSILDSDTGIIAEFKRRSPSKGEIHPMADVEEVVSDYSRNGAACCSVLTDTCFFGGSLIDFGVARAATDLPLIRKDFIIDEYQIYQSRYNCADAILLIASVLSAADISNFIKIAHNLNMETLLEIHNTSELDKFDPATDLVGINNRNLHNFVTDIEASCRLIEQLPPNVVKISESGISMPSQIRELRQAGFDGFLIGETFMRHDQPGLALKQFINGINQTSTQAATA